MGQPSGRPICLAELSKLAIDVVFRLQALHVIFYPSLIGFIRHACERGLHFLDGIVEVALAAIDAGQTDVGRPIVGKFLRV